MMRYLGILYQKNQQIRVKSRVRCIQFSKLNHIDSLVNIENKIAAVQQFATLKLYRSFHWTNKRQITANSTITLTGHQYKYQ